MKKQVQDFLRDLRTNLCEFLNSTFVLRSNCSFSARFPLDVSKQQLGLIERKGILCTFFCRDERGQALVEQI